MNPCRTDCPAGDCAGCVFPPNKPQAQEAQPVKTNTDRAPLAVGHKFSPLSPALAGLEVLP